MSADFLRRITALEKRVADLEKNGVGVVVRLPPVTVAGVEYVDIGMGYARASDIASAKPGAAVCVYSEADLGLMARIAALEAKRGPGRPRKDAA